MGHRILRRVVMLCTPAKQHYHKLERRNDRKATNKCNKRNCGIEVAFHLVFYAMFRYHLGVIFDVS